MTPTPLSYTLVITGAPWSSQAPQSALAFARELVTAGHRVDRVFLYGEGVLLASALVSPPSDEVHWPRQWAGFLTEHSLPAPGPSPPARPRALSPGGRRRKPHPEHLAPPGRDKRVVGRRGQARRQRPAGAVYASRLDTRTGRD